MAPAALLATPSRDTPKSVMFPNGAWDTHHHIFEPETFPYSNDRHLTPPAATIEKFNAFKNSLGITHSILTHGLSYGDDCTSLKAFVPRLGRQQTLAIGVIDPDNTPDEELLSMAEAGVRGLRVNLYKYKAMEDVQLQKRALSAHLRRITDLSLPWSLTMTTINTVFWDELEPFVEAEIVPSGIRLVTDHFGLVKGASLLSPEFRADPTSQPGFQSILRLVRKGHLWVKLSAPYRVSEQAPLYQDLQVLVRAFVDANKHRVLWGSDWPHTPRMKVRGHEEAMKVTPYLEVNDEAWLRSLRSWLSDDEWHLLMVENPKAIFASGQI
ncbi:hypothetical protein B0T11DRAFT_112433 [Plectosphaerella cucumerina]|uniref:Amidohydrolase-related domain-containing protein n=1 Tax=Plectosphaerella cucumerina TaxID=40658 RepID=A0A8K0TIE6_9PEZI|nr:hypothetical protein B0T11DRAFT_112433 [Plectosphaerella cucumerina]